MSNSVTEAWSLDSSLVHFTASSRTHRYMDRLIGCSYHSFCLDKPLFLLLLFYFSRLPRHDYWFINFFVGFKQDKIDTLFFFFWRVGGGSRNLFLIYPSTTPGILLASLCQQQRFLDDSFFPPPIQTITTNGLIYLLFQLPGDWCDLFWQVDPRSIAKSRQNWPSIHLDYPTGCRLQCVSHSASQCY